MVSFWGLLVSDFENFLFDLFVLVGDEEGYLGRRFVLLSRFSLFYSFGWVLEAFYLVFSSFIVIGFCSGCFVFRKLVMRKSR